jgi:hypothetical protein
MRAWWTAVGSDDLGIDRRRRRRGEAGRDADALDDVVFASHVPFDPTSGQLLGVRSREGAAWVRALSVCPTGVLVQAIDLDDPPRTSAARLALGSTMRALLPAMLRGGSSPLSATGLTVLSPRFVYDLGAWAQARGAATPVELVRADPSGTPRCVTGRLAPLTDPSPGILAVALDPAVCAQLIAEAATSR